MTWSREFDEPIRIGVVRAMNRHYATEFKPKGKEPHWDRRKLKRDE